MGVPIAGAENTTVLPAATVCDCGGAVKTGTAAAGLTVSVAASLVTVPAKFVARTA